MKHVFKPAKIFKKYKPDYQYFTLLNVNSKYEAYFHGSPLYNPNVKQIFMIVANSPSYDPIFLLKYYVLQSRL